MSFKFRLQRVLELREQSEQARARAVRDATDSAEDARRRQDALVALRTLQRDSLTAVARGFITAGEMQHLQFVIGALDDRLVRASDDVRVAERAVADAQAALQLASRDRRVLDRLKDRHSARWNDAARQQDRSLMDEIALTQFTRRTLAALDARDAGIPAAPPSTSQAARRTPTPMVTTAISPDRAR
jgi:flagellar protein FliJ